MGYVRIIIHLAAGGTRSGVRSFSEPVNLEDIRIHALYLASQTLGRAAIADVTVQEVPATDPAVVALILRDQANKKPFPSSDGTHPYLKMRGGKRRH
jgi:hypothetical protein